MPELPEVETMARDLRALLVGATVRSVWTDWPRVIAHPGPGEFAREIEGRVVGGVGRRAKWVLVELSGSAVLAIQVKMTGQIFVVPADAPRDRHVHLAFGLDDGRELRLRDMRKFARVGLYRRDEAGTIAGREVGTDLFGAHGPEPLDPSFTLGRFRERLHTRRGRLKPLLLDQGFLAGIGNIYADEALWLARLHPLRSAGSLGPAAERRLYRAIQDVLREAIERRGSSVDDYTAPEGDGTMQEHLAVYQRTGEPCLRCGRPIRRIVVGQRGTHFCGWCQRLPATDRPAAVGILRLREGDTAPGGARTAATRRAAAKRRAAARVNVPRGPRWTELPAGPGVVGLRAGEGHGRHRVAEEPPTAGAGEHAGALPAAPGGQVSTSPAPASPEAGS